MNRYANDVFCSRRIERATHCDVVVRYLTADTHSDHDPICALPVRQIRIAMFNLEKLDTHPTLWGRTHEERWGALDDATHELNQKLGNTALMTGAQLALRHIDELQKPPKAKCPFTPQREMITKLWGENARGAATKPLQGTLF